MVAPRSTAASDRIRPPCRRDDPLYGRQADSSAFELCVLVEALEPCEELIGTGQIEPGPIVTYAEDGVFSMVL
jgi:hypothetical protein